MSDADIASKLAGLDQRLDELETMKRTFQAFSLAIGTSKPVLTEEEEELRALRAELPSGEAFRTAINKATKQAKAKSRKSQKKTG